MGLSQPYAALQSAWPSLDPSHKEEKTKAILGPPADRSSHSPKEREGTEALRTPACRDNARLPKGLRCVDDQ